MMSDGLGRPRVSIGLPIRNGGKLLDAALRSVLQQTFQNLEIIVSDNGSDDGSADLLKAYASNDNRIQYFRQEQPLSAYDNFHFVLKQARGEYFMWAAHDDTRDDDYVYRLLTALEQNPAAVLAFGDLNVVTPENPGGQIVPFPFQTAGMGKLARLAKLSRMQCYYIYGLWRKSAIERVPYAYCSWWPDLPMMLSAALLGTYIHVPGTRFNYLELPKSNLHRVRNQDFSQRFNLVFAVVSLVRATYSACAGVGGFLVGLYCASLVVLKQVINLPGYLYRQLGRVIGNR